MRSSIVFTLTGKDRVGIVEEVTGVLLEMGGNVETSRMVRLGGEFAILMLVSLPAARLADLGVATGDLQARGYRVTTSQTETAGPAPRVGWASYRIEVQGADHEGIIHEIAHGLSRRGINIESVDTETRQASISGAPLFAMTARVAVPPELVESDWIAVLLEAGQQANVDIEVTSVDWCSGD